MAYDFNTTVTKILQLRKECYHSHPPTPNTTPSTPTPTTNTNTNRTEQLTELIETYATFSAVCPMTPLLWMYYAYDSATMMRHLLFPGEDTTTTTGDDDEDDTRNDRNEEEEEDDMDKTFEIEISILELGLEEFPGCALLRCYYFDTLCGQYIRKFQLRRSMNSNDSDHPHEEEFQRTKEDEEENEMKLQMAFEDAVGWIGRGSHWNEDQVLVWLYDTYVRCLVICLSYNNTHSTISNNHHNTSSSPSEQSQPQPQSQRTKDKLRTIFLLRAQTPSMSNGGNDSLLYDMQTIHTRFQPPPPSQSHPATATASSSILKLFEPSDYQLVEQTRRLTCTNPFYTSHNRFSSADYGTEMEVEIAMGYEGVLLGMKDVTFWDTLIQGGGGGGSSRSSGSSGGNTSKGDRRYRQGNRLLHWESFLTPPSSSPPSPSPTPPTPTPSSSSSSDGGNNSMDVAVVPPSYLMGNGMVATSTAFLQHIASVQKRVRDAKATRNNQPNKKKKKNDNNDNDDNNDDDEEDEEERQKAKQRQTAIQTLESTIEPIYERAISECPTVEHLWETYIHHLIHRVRRTLDQLLVATSSSSNHHHHNHCRNNQDGVNGHDDREDGMDKDGSTTTNVTALRTQLTTWFTNLTTVCDRSVRNCPYSVTLYILRLRCRYGLSPPYTVSTLDDGESPMDDGGGYGYGGGSGCAAAATTTTTITTMDGARIFDPEDLIRGVREALENGFITDAGRCLDLYLGVIRMVKERILALVSCGTTMTTVKKTGGDVVVDDDDAGKGNKNKKGEGKGRGWHAFDEAEGMVTGPVKKKRRRKKKKKMNGEDNGDDDGDDDDDDDEDMRDENEQVMNLSLVHYYSQNGLANEGNGNDDDGVDEEIRDLLEDLRSMYDTADDFLYKKHKDWTVGKTKLLLDRAETEAYIIDPMMRHFRLREDSARAVETTMNDDDGGGVAATRATIDDQDEAVKWYERLVRVHYPPHPTSWRKYIRYVEGKHGCVATTAVVSVPSAERRSVTLVREPPAVIVARIRCVRGLYHRAVASAKQSNKQRREQKLRGVDDGILYVDPEMYAAYERLFEEYVEFERRYGSKGSLLKAEKETRNRFGAMAVETTTVQKAKATVAVDNEVEGGDKGADLQNGVEKKGYGVGCSDLDNKKRAREEENNDVPITKKVKADTETVDDVVMASPPPPILAEPPKKTNLKVLPDPSKVSHHKIRIGHLDYPAHPFTVHVSNLSDSTEDMDLVDLFRARGCGAIVHARILRENSSSDHRRSNNKVTKNDYSGKGRSKGVGLVQFEERESVEVALALSGEVGLHEHLIVVKRSHQAAMGIVPKGMERIGHRGKKEEGVEETNKDEGGRGSGGGRFKANANRKRNERRNRTRREDDNGGDRGSTLSEKRPSDSKDTDTQSHSTERRYRPSITAAMSVPAKNKNATKTAMSSILAFRPRGVKTPAQAGRRRKTMNLLPEKTNDS